MLDFSWINEQLFPGAEAIMYGCENSAVSYSGVGEEVVYAEKMREKRQKEFFSGRFCAQRALKGLGIEDYALVNDENRAPIWPESVIGSISHTNKYSLAVVARKTETFVSLGIDLEAEGRLREKLWQQALVEDEIAWVKGFDDLSECEKWATVLFSAKEAFYKAQNPVTKEWLGFKEAAVAINEKNNSFELNLLGEKEILGKRAFAGRYFFFNDHVISGIQL